MKNEESEQKELNYFLRGLTALYLMTLNICYFLSTVLILPPRIRLLLKWYAAFAVLGNG
jgi:hypothetical protein